LLHEDLSYIRDRARGVPFLSKVKYTLRDIIRLPGSNGKTTEEAKERNGCGIGLVYWNLSWSVGVVGKRLRKGKQRAE